MKSNIPAIILSLLLSQTATAIDRTCLPDKADDLIATLKSLDVKDISSDGIPKGFCLEEWFQQGFDAFRTCAETKITKEKDTLADRPEQDLLCGFDYKCVAYPSAKASTYMCVNTINGDFTTAGGSDGNYVIGNWKDGHFTMPDGTGGNFYTGKAGSRDNDGTPDDVVDDDDDDDVDDILSGIAGSGSGSGGQQGGDKPGAAAGTARSSAVFLVAAALLAVAV